MQRVRKFSLRLDAAPEATPDGLYAPRFAPWLGFGEFPDFYERAFPVSLVGAERCYVLYSLAKQALPLPGKSWECGVYKGGRAAMLAAIIASWDRRRSRLFDTFAGMPSADPASDLHQVGDFADTSLDAVQQYVGHGDFVRCHQGLMPDIFKGLESSLVAFAHVDV
jgi:O-methyltransferase